MKDIPAFTTENGIASLVLRDIPYSKRAYVSIVSSDNIDTLMEDVIRFCKALDTQELLGYGEIFAGRYPLEETVLLMEGPKVNVDTVVLKPVCEEDAKQFCALYNEKMKHLKTVCLMTLKEANRLICGKQAYFILENDCRIGFGVVTENEIRALAAMTPGTGKKVVCALGRLISGDRIRLEVAGSNTKALQLYDGLGFKCVKVMERWYKIF